MIGLEGIIGGIAAVLAGAILAFVTGWRKGAKDADAKHMEAQAKANRKAADARRDVDGRDVVSRRADLAKWMRDAANE